MEKHYLLTGSTGVVGSALFKLLLKMGEKVTLLIRADSDAHLNKRVDHLMKFCGFAGGEHPQVTALKADLYEEKFGLSHEAYVSLEKSITHILHCAGNVNMSLAYTTAMSRTMSMTLNVVMLMESGNQARKMEYISTVGVAGHTPDEIKEDWITHKREFRNSYEAAKAEAEHFIHQKIKSGLNITVHRPSMVVGEGKTGKNISFQVFYYLCEFLSGANSFGWIPDLKGMRLDIIPADYVARAIYWSSCQEKTPISILHLCSGPDSSLELNSLVLLVRDIFKANGRVIPAIRQIPVKGYLFLLGLLKCLVSKKTRRALNTLPVFFAYLQCPQCFSNTKTVELLGSCGITLPDSKKCVAPVLSYYLEKTRRAR